MRYLNVQILGLSGRPHPILHNVCTTQDVKKLRLHLKFLTCDYLTNERLAKDRPYLSSTCDLCTDHGTDCTDSIEHVLTSCKATREVRSRLYSELVNTVALVQPMCAILTCHPLPPDILTQFILDCTSANLPESFRIPLHNPDISKVYKISRDWCYGISSERSRLLKTISNK